jgi:hypothetical protein
MHSWPKQTNRRVTEEEGHVGYERERPCACDVEKVNHNYRIENFAMVGELEKPLPSGAGWNVFGCGVVASAKTEGAWKVPA